MSKLRSLNTAFWSDSWIEDLSPSEKLLYLYLITNEKTNMLGIYEMSMSRMSFETGLDKGKINAALDTFSKLGKVSYQHNFIILVNFLKHQNFNSNMKKSAIDAYNNLPNKLKPSDLQKIEERDSEGFRTLCKAFGMVRKEEVELEVEIEVEEEEEIEREKEARFSFKKSLCDYGANESIVSQWLKVRKAKKGVNTEIALKRFLREVEDADMAIDDVLMKCIEKSWAGFEASWVENTKHKTHGKSERNADRNSEVLQILRADDGRGEFGHTG